MAQGNVKLRDEGVIDVPRIRRPDRLQKQMERAREAALTLYARGESVWVETDGKLTRYRICGKPAIQ